MSLRNKSCFISYHVFQTHSLWKLKICRIRRSVNEIWWLWQRFSVNTVLNFRFSHKTIIWSQKMWNKAHDSYKLLLWFFFLYFWSLIAPVPIHFHHIKNRQWTFSKKILCSLKSHNNLMTAEDMGKKAHDWYKLLLLYYNAFFVTSEAQHL